MEIKDKPATPTPSRLLGTILILGGGVFIGDFFWAMATYSPSLEAAPLTAWGVLVSGLIGGSLLVGVGMAAVLHSSGYLELARSIDWNM